MDDHDMTGPGPIPENTLSMEANSTEDLSSEPKTGFVSPGENTQPVPLTERRAHESIFWIERNLIEPNPYQPRREFDVEALRGLADSLKAHGMLQPITVSRIEVQTNRGFEVRYQLIAGERRWRAAALAGMEQVPVIIKKEPSGRLKLELAVIENVQREDLNPIERAKAFRQLMEEFHLLQREVASRVGKSREMVANTIRLLSLPEEIQNAIVRGEITEGHARAILMAGENREAQKQIYQTIVASKFTVRQAENYARRFLGREKIDRRRFGTPGDVETLSWETRLQELFGTKVHVQKLGDKGKIVIEFYSDEELRGIIDKVLQEKEEGLAPGGFDAAPVSQAEAVPVYQENPEIKEALEENASSEAEIPPAQFSV